MPADGGFFSDVEQVGDRLSPLCAWNSWPRQPATDTGSIRTPCINQGRGSTGVGHREAADMRRADSASAQLIRDGLDGLPADPTGLN